MSEREFGEQYIDYLLGALKAHEADRLKRHLRVCAECRRNIRELEAALRGVSPPPSPQPPPLSLRRRLLRSIAVRPPRRGFVWWRALAIGASILALLSGLTSWRLLETIRENEAQIAALRLEGQRLREAGQTLTLRVQDLTAPGVQVLRLTAQSDFAGVSGQVFIRSERRRALVFLHGLPASAPGRAYQLWILESGHPPHPSKTFRPEGGKAEFNVRLPAFVRIAAVAVSVEPSQGSPQPTGPIVASGNLGSTA